MRRNAGSFVRAKMVQLGMLGNAGAGVLMGLGLSPLFYLVDRWAGLIWAGAAYSGVAVVVYILVRRLHRPSDLDNWRKGADAETRVGQTIEYAITAENCAVAHSVTEIAKVGDIDHLVATPVAIWVIETKYQRVPPKSFPEVLSRIAANTNAVREWAPAGTQVRGCLVLAYETRKAKKSYSQGNEEIAAYTEDSLRTFMHKLQTEARSRRSLDERIAKDIWKLGHVPE